MKTNLDLQESLKDLYLSGDVDVVANVLDAEKIVAISELKTSDKEIVVLRLEYKSFAEISSILDKSVNTLKVNMNRIRARIEKTVRENIEKWLKGERLSAFNVDENSEWLNEKIFSSIAADHKPKKISQCVSSDDEDDKQFEISSTVDLWEERKKKKNYQVRRRAKKVTKTEKANEDLLIQCQINKELKEILEIVSTNPLSPEHLAMVKQLCMLLSEIPKAS